MATPPPAAAKFVPSPAAECTSLLLSLAGEGSPEAVRAAVCGGANVNGTDDRGWTALMHACHVGNVSVAVLLLKLPTIDVEAVNSAGQSALDLAQEAHPSKSPEASRQLCRELTRRLAVSQDRIPIRREPCLVTEESFEVPSEDAFSHLPRALVLDSQPF